MPAGEVTADLAPQCHPELFLVRLLYLSQHFHHFFLLSQIQTFLSYAKISDIELRPKFKKIKLLVLRTLLLVLRTPLD